MRPSPPSQRRPAPAGSGEQRNCSTRLGQEATDDSVSQECLEISYMLCCYVILFLIFFYFYSTKINKEARFNVTRCGYWVSLRNHIFGWWFGTEISYQTLRTSRPLSQSHSSLLLPITVTTIILITFYLCCFSPILLLQPFQLVCSQVLILYSFEIQVIC